MKCAAALALLMLSAPAAAIWPFGPSDADECIEDYAVQGATRRLIGAGMAQCRHAFDPGQHRAVRAAALCVAKRVPEMKADAAFGVVLQRCRDDAGVARCAFPAVLDTTSNACR